nr:hypothetical protein [Paracoccaceae bacterium]
MPTSFEVIFLGTLAKIDTTQGNETMENAAGLLGSYGTAGSPLHGAIRNLTAGSLSEDDGATYDVDNGGGYDTFRINGGALQSFDGVASYAAVITYSDGTTASVNVVVFQDINGNTYLAPSQTNDVNQQALTAKPIQSLQLNSVNVGAGPTGDMVADRFAGDFKSVVDGTSGNDTMNVGYTDAQGDQITEGNDSINGGAGNDTINAGGGNDTINAGDGADSLNGGNGNDQIYGQGGNDTVTASAGYDVVYGGDGNDNLSGGSDIYDDLYGGAGDDSLYGGTYGGNYVFGGSGQDSIFGGEGSGDLVAGGAGNDTAYGGNGADAVGGGTGNDSVFGGAGNDTVSGDDGADTVDAGTGNDQVMGGSGADSIIAGDGADLVRGDVLAGNISFYASLQDGPATSATFVNNSTQTVELFFINSSGTPISYGTIAPGQSTNVSTYQYHNWALRDTSTSEWVAVYTGDLDQTNTYAGPGNDTITGGQGADTIHGDGGNDSIDSGTENDTVFGGSGNDTVTGGSNDDSIEGGAGNDSIG